MSRPLPSYGTRHAARLHPWLLLAAVALLTAGCDRVGTALEDRAERLAERLAEPVAELEPEPVLGPDELLERELTLYRECIGQSSQRIHQSWQRYDERIGPNGTPRKKGTEPFLYKIDTELTPCIDAARRGPQLPPPLPDIEQAMADYLEHARAFAMLSVQLDTYYERQGYTEDDWAEGKQLAPEISAAYEAWSQADARLRRLVADRKDAVERRLLAEVEHREGKSAQWHTRRLVLAARAFVRCAVAEEPPDDDGDCQAAHTALTTANSELVDYRLAHTEATDAVFWMSSFRDSAERLLSQAEEVMPALRKHKVTADDRVQLQRALDDLVSDAQNLRFE